MSSTASNYDVSYLVMGIVLASISILLAIVAIWSRPLLSKPDGIFFVFTLILYGLMMFASSYVEEEQHFWYWITGGWVAYISCVQYVQGMSKIGSQN